MLKIEDLEVSYGAVQALRGISMEVNDGEIVSLIGANGAGKTTTLHAITGLVPIKSGSVIYDGHDLRKTDPSRIVTMGLAHVPEGRQVFTRMTVAENLAMGAYFRKDKKAIAEDLERVYARFPRLKERAKQLAGTLSGGEQQMLAMGRAIMSAPKLIVMDEPTAAITDREVELLFEHIRSLTAKGVAIIYISHRMDEIFSICDRVSVYRDGQYIGSGDTKDLDEAQLIKMMVGREITDVFPKLEAEIGDVVFEAKNIVRADNKVKGVSLSVRRGEILGIGGLVGAGRSELVEGIFGMHELASGEIFVKGKQVKVHSPKDIIKEGVALITEDRKVTGLNLSGSVNDNIAMVAIKKLLSHGLYNKNKARAASMEYIKKLNIKTPSGDQITGNLSGGNQQKIVIAKWLLNDPDIIILDEPTRGIDVGAKRDIYLLLGKLVQQGKAVIMISSEIPELMGVCDRIMVMCEGNLSGEVQRDAFSQERIMTLASAIEV